MTRVAPAWPLAITVLAVVLEVWALPARQHWAPLTALAHHGAFGVGFAVVCSVIVGRVSHRAARVALGGLVVVVATVCLVDALHTRATGGRLPREIVAYVLVGGDDWLGSALRLALASIRPWAHEAVAITIALLAGAWVVRRRQLEVTWTRLLIVGVLAAGTWWFVPPQLVQGVGPRLHNRLSGTWPRPDVPLRPPDVVYEAPVVSSVGRPANVVVVVLESIRFDRIGAWNPTLSPDPMPFVSQLARDGLQVTTAHTTVTHTSKATWGLLCGAWPSLTGETPRLDGPVRCLPQLLADVGYTTAYVHGSRRAFEGWGAMTDSLGFGRSVHFEDLGVPATGPFGAADHVILPAFEGLLRTDQPFLLVVQTASAHYPYALPGRAVPASRAALRAAYDDEVLPYTDRFVEQVFRRLKDQDLLENTLVVVTSDHGEAFGDYGDFIHDLVPQEVAQRVPLLLHTPASWGLQGRRVDGLRHHLDVVPTVLELLQIPWKGTLPGRSLLGSGHATSLTSCWLTERCVGWRTETHKLIHHYGRRRDQHFDRRTDPEERVDLGPPDDDAYHDLVHQLRSIDAFWSR